MADTNIDWADKVWNPVTGCTKISEGCRNCYAERMSKRLAGRCGYLKDNPFAVTLHPEKLEEPLKWKKPQKIFVCSMGDLFHEKVPVDMIRSIFWTMLRCPQHRFLLLTKRPERAAEYFQELTRGDHRNVPKNIWFGVTVENQQAADERIPLLLHIPAAKRFISIEPMVGPVDIDRLAVIDGEPSNGTISGYLLDGLTGEAWDHENGYLSEASEVKGIGWVILGGETGPKASPLHPDWVRSVRDQCQAAGVPFFFKQWGEWAEVKTGGVLNKDICMSVDGFIDTADKNYVCFANESDGVHLRRVGKKAAGHLLDGKEYRELPE